MGYFTLTGVDGKKVVISSDSVSKVVDFNTYRTIYQGSDANHHQVKESLTAVLNSLVTASKS